MASHPSVTPISTDQVPPPAGHYSHAVRAGQTLYISGQLPIGADGAPLADAAFDEQAQQALANMLAILEAAGGAPHQLARVTVYIVGIANWPAFNAVFAALMGSVRPARTVVPVPELHHGVLVEVDAIALLTADAAA